MSEPTASPTAPALRPRPVSLATILVIFAALGLFLFLVDMTYLRTTVPAPQNQRPDHLDKAHDWEATPETRRAYLAELRAKQAKQAASYGWVDEKAGVVQLPIDRAVDLVIQEYGPAK